MKRKAKFTVRQRRKRAGKTDYKKRLSILKGSLPRLVVRKSLKNILVQLIDYSASGDKVKACARSTELNKYGWPVSKSNLSSAYLTGLLLAKKAQNSGIKKALLDIGLQRGTVGSRLFAALKGAIDGGLEIPHGEEVLPSEERIKGKHIEDYAKKLKSDNSEKYKKQFSGYEKKNSNPESLGVMFDQVKSKIQGGTS
ncbi:50S ribosomal protein L18 [Nanoarchaeota archaeon]